MAATKAEAQIVLKEVEKLYAPYIEAMETKPELMQGDVWNGGDTWTVCWEEGPYEWAGVFPAAVSVMGDGYQDYPEDHLLHWEQIQKRLRHYGMWTEAFRNYQLGVYRTSEV
jgi:hypothetical protein